ncbi:phosphoribosyl-ATP diphosphatase [Candidatus Hecatella orcuttiae]|uniref:phosphoribosyl-ATP diphosphatase n=1 Tax=Candidatus Hecatella orcuttiae TaxID=1935119 RepID=UPI002867C895|nr:phosphoribosyl-ATP diphosphatase [Candidatus Hecatella orcuttiae]
MSLEVLSEVYRVIEDRRHRPKPGSYVSSLLKGGVDKVLGKVKEEAQELVKAARGGERQEIVHEAADLVFHTWVLLVFKGIKLEELLQELRRRRR